MKARTLIAAAGLAGVLALSGCGGSDDPPPKNGGGADPAPASTPAFPRDQITNEIQNLMQSVYSESNHSENVCKKYVDLKRMAGGDLSKCRVDVFAAEGMSFSAVPEAQVQVDPVGVYETENPEIVAVMSESVTALDEDGEVWPTNNDPLSVWFFTKESGKWKFAGANLEGDTEAIPGDS